MRESGIGFAALNRIAVTHRAWHLHRPARRSGLCARLGRRAKDAGDRRNDARLSGGGGADKTAGPLGDCRRRRQARRNLSRRALAAGRDVDRAGIDWAGLNRPARRGTRAIAWPRSRARRHGSGIGYAIPCNIRLSAFRQFRAPARCAFCRQACCQRGARAPAEAALLARSRCEASGGGAVNHAIRPATLANAPALARIHQSCFDEAWDAANPFAASWQGRPGLFSWAGMRLRVSCSPSFWFRPWPMKRETLSIGTFRRAPHGSRTRASSRLRQKRAQGGKAMFLEVAHDNCAALALYRSMRLRCSWKTPGLLCAPSGSPPMPSRCGRACLSKRPWE